MQIIIPMAGIGQRFATAGYLDPKPLIEVDEKPLIEHVIKMFPGAEHFLFICNKNHLEKTNLSEVIKSIHPSAVIVGIDQHKLGPVHSLLRAKEHIIDNEPTLTCYCDVNVHWNFDEFKSKMQTSSADGALIAFKGFHPPLLQEGFYATARLSENNEIAEVREKFSFTPNKMDSWTSAGLHYFKQGSILKKYAQSLVDKNILCNNEYYISLVHNLLIEDGLKNVLFPVEYFISWGKPEDLREYQYWSRHFNTPRE